MVFEYQSDSEPDGDYVTRVRAELVNGRVQFTIGKSSVTHGILLSTAALTSTDFTSVLLSMDKGNNKMYLVVGSAAEQNYGLAQQYPIKVSRSAHCH